MSISMWNASNEIQPKAMWAKLLIEFHLPYYRLFVQPACQPAIMLQDLKIICYIHICPATNKLTRQILKTSWGKPELSLAKYWIWCMVKIHSYAMLWLLLLLCKLQESIQHAQVILYSFFCFVCEADVNKMENLHLLLAVFGTLYVMFSNWLQCTIHGNDY